MEEWQPIETAPDGELILVYDKWGGYKILWWRHPTDYMIFNSGGGITHWMRLTKPKEVTPTV